jgi:hypothetical protein
MPLDGVLRPGSGGAGAAVLRLTSVPYTNREVVSGSAFGLAATAAGTAVVACSVTPGTPHSWVRYPEEERLRLVRLTADGRDSSQDDGPFGRGIWFGAAPGDAFYAIAVRDTGPARTVLVHRWEAPGAGSWSSLGTTITDRLFAQAVRSGRFAAGVGPDGSLYIAASTRKLAVLQLRPDGSSDRFDLVATGSPDVRLFPGMHRLVVEEDGRMLVTCTGRAIGRTKGRQPAPAALVRSVRILTSSVEVDPDWAVDGVWTSPPGFVPVELLPSPQNVLVCAGWIPAGAKFGFSVLHIAPDGTGGDVASGGPPVLDQAIPTQVTVDSSGGVLGAATLPSLVSLFLVGQPEWGYVWRHDPAGELDVAFGTIQGMCYAEHRGYPLAVRGLATTSAGFFLACDRSADIQWTDSLPVVFAFTPSGHAQHAFGDAGIVHHEEIPADVVLHEASEIVAVGDRKISNPPPQANAPPPADEFELAVTRLSSSGHVRWQYGTSHGLRSAALFMDGQRINFFQVSALTRWRGLLAIGGSAGVPAHSGFVTFRDQYGDPYPAGPGTTLAIGDVIQSLTPLPDGSLEVVYRVGSPVEVKQVRITPALTLDPAPPVNVPAPLPGLGLGDGSRVEARTTLTDLGTSQGFVMWLVRTRPDGSIDPQFGGGNPTPPMYLPDVARRITRPGFKPMDMFDLPGGVLALPGGGYTAIVRLRPFHAGEQAALPTGVLATRWGANGWPDQSWADGVLHPGFVVVNQVLVDDPARIVLIGAIEPAAKGSRTPALVGLRTADGTRDPAFGAQGLLLVPLRGPERRVVHAAVTRPDGTTVLPVREDTERDVRPQRALAWIEVI